MRLYNAAAAAAAGCGIAMVLGLGGCTPSPRPAADPEGRAGRPYSVERLDSAEAVARAAAMAATLTEGVAVAPGLELRPWAPEELMIDPHALTMDDEGRVYVLGSGRTRTQRAVNRRFRKDLAATLRHRTVEDLRAFLRERLHPDLSPENQDWLPDLNRDGFHDWRDLMVEKERVYRVSDTTGDGLADLSEVIVEDFHSEVTDISGGLLVEDGDVYIAVAPDLWRLTDVTGDGIPDARESISHGYGVRLGFFAHGMSGLRMGPDGRIYWAVGDVGFDIEGASGERLSYPNQGAILRANPDGSDVEVFAAGLRNPYEFDFDEYGNVIGADNDGDRPGEEERLVHLIEGSDSGWRTNWQYGKYTDPDNNRYRVWIDEGLHLPRFEGQPAHILPPVALIDDGPAGLVYNPGTALDERSRGRFFLASASAVSTIHSFRLDPVGASFSLADDTVVVEGLLVPSMAFGPDGRLYLGDLVARIKDQLGGRIWTLDAPGAAANPTRIRTHELLTSGFEHRPDRELVALLRYPDMRVRKKAQFELVEREAVGSLLRALRRGTQRLQRIHGLWGMGQLGRRRPELGRDLLEVLTDPDAEVRAQAARVLGDIRYEPAGEALIPLLGDERPRVRMFAAQALGRIGHAPAVQPLIEMLEADAGRDAHLRHAAIIALGRIGLAEPLVALAEHPSAALQSAAVVALRRMRHPGVARFLGSSHPSVVSDAARAISDDGGIPAALPALARLLENDGLRDEAVLRRAINANLRLNDATGAARVAAFAANPGAAAELRVEALEGLRVWESPSVFDRVDGMYRGPVAGDPAIARAALAKVMRRLSSAGEEPVRTAAARAAARLGLAAPAAARPTVAASAAERGREIALEDPRAACTQCHTFGGGGSQVGPDLSRIGATLSREQLREALLEPSARIAPGYGVPGQPSIMPPMGDVMDDGEIRDLVEFLATLR